jgi:hypothetical protein
MYRTGEERQSPTRIEVDRFLTKGCLAGDLVSTLRVYGETLDFPANAARCSCCIRDELVIYNRELQLGGRRWRRDFQFITVQLIVYA